MLVSIHTPTQGVTIYRNTLSMSHHRFNPHTHAGCDLCITVWKICLWVSIHTPTQGVTLRFRGSLDISIVSIHTPTQGVTPPSFNNFTFDNVSIHTPTQGVTRIFVLSPFSQHVSIHTPTQGVTALKIGFLFHPTFQSTHPRRV